MSTLEQEYEEAVEIVAKWLSRLDGVDWEGQTTTGHKFWKRKAYELLNLTWPSGQPVIGVISQDQELPESNLCHRCEGNGAIYADGKAHFYTEHAPTIPCPSCGGNGREIVDGERLRDEGFRRVVLPGESGDGKDGIYMKGVIMRLIQFKGQSAVEFNDGDIFYQGQSIGELLIHLSILLPKDWNALEIRPALKQEAMK